jgi:PST family polysaccharide transporter
VLLILTEIIIWTLEGVAFPVLSRLQHDPERGRRAFYALVALSWAVAVPCFLLLAILAPEVIGLAFGPRWSPAVPVMQALALVGIPHSLVYANKAAINAGGRPEVSLRLALLTGLVSVVGFAVVVRWGIVAVALSYTISGYLLALVSVAVTVRVLALDTRTYLRQLLAPLLSGALMVMAVVAAKVLLADEVSDLLNLAVCGTVAGLVYLGMLCVTARSQVRALATLVRGPTRT